MRQAKPSTVYLVGAGPGDPGLITRRGLELLRDADVILVDELCDRALLVEAKPGATIVNVGKRGAEPKSKENAQDRINEELFARAKGGASVVRLKGGDPYLFGRGAEEAEFLAERGIRFEVVPGVPSLLGAAAYAGISVTHRDLASSLLVLTAATREGEPIDLRGAKDHVGTVVVMMGLSRLGDLAERFIALGRPRDTPAAVISKGTLPDQRVVVSTLGEIAHEARTQGLATPALIVIGEVVRKRETLSWFEKKPLFGRTVTVLRAAHQAASVLADLRLRGARPLALPLLEMGPPPNPEVLAGALGALHRFGVVVFTSENGVRRVLDAMLERGLDPRAFGAAKIAAIGPGTAKALRSYGILCDWVPEAYVGEALAEFVIERAAPCRVAIFRALVARDVVPDSLRAAGFEVDVIPAYETRPSDRSIARLREIAADLDIVLLSSSSMAEALASALRDPALPRPKLIASIGPVTTRTAESLGFRVDVTATVSTFEGLVDALETHLLALA